MKKFWTYIDGRGWSKESKYRFALVTVGTVFALAGLALWLLISQWVLSTRDWMFCFAGYPAAGAFVYVFLYTCGHELHHGKPKTVSIRGFRGRSGIKRSRRVSAVAYPGETGYNDSEPQINGTNRDQGGKSMKKWTGIAALILSVAALAVSVTALVLALRPAEKAAEEQTDIQYVLYLGTNDKDTNQPVFAPEEAREKAQEILVRHFGGYTIQEANGGWIDGDTVYREYTLVIYLSDTDLNAVHSAANEMISTFNQSSVLIQSNRTTTEFYAGGN